MRLVERRQVLAMWPTETQTHDVIHVVTRTLHPMQMNSRHRNLLVDWTWRHTMRGSMKCLHDVTSTFCCCIEMNLLTCLSILICAIQQAPHAWNAWLCFISNPDFKSPLSQRQWKISKFSLHNSANCLWTRNRPITKQTKDLLHCKHNTNQPGAAWA